MRGWLLAAVSLIPAACGVALAGRQPARLFNSTDGLPTDAASEVLVDAAGFVWLASPGGLSRFDGQSFTVFGPEHGLAGSAQALVEDRRGRVWVGTSKGLFVFRPDAAPRLESVRAEGTARDLPTGTACVASNGDVIAASLDTVYRIRPDGLPAASEIWRAPTPSIFALACDRDGRAWLARRDGAVTRLDPGGAATTFGREAGWPHDWLRGLAVDRLGNLWVTTGAGVCVGRADAAAGTKLCRRIIDRVDGHGFEFGSHVVESRDGSIWIVADDAVARFTPPENLEGPIDAERFGAAEGLAATAPHGLAEDAHGQLWITDGARGLFRFAPRGVTRFGPEEGLPGGNVAAFAEDPSGDLWAVSAGSAGSAGGRSGRWIARFDGRRWDAARYPSLDEDDDPGWGWNQVVAWGRDGSWWFAGGRGLYGYRPGPPRPARASRRPDFVVERAAGLPGSQVFRLYAARDGTHWLAPLGESAAPVARFDPLRRSAVACRVDGLPDPKVPVAFAEDARGRIWFAAGGGGVARLEPGTDGISFRGFGAEAGLPIERAWALAIDGRGRIWLGTVSGLYVADDPGDGTPRFREVERRVERQARGVTALATDAAGSVYAGTHGGVEVLRADGSPAARFGVAAGLPSSVVNAIFVRRNGEVWIATADGAARLPAARHPPGIPLAPRIAALATAGGPLAVSEDGTPSVDGIVLGPGDAVLEVRLRAVDLRPEAPVTFSTRLDGRRGADWSPPSAQREVRLVGLAPGRYVLRARAHGVDGSVSAEEARVAFRVLAPFWQRGWFLTLAACALGALAYGAYRVRMTRLLAVERVRSRIATDLHDEIGAGLSQIAVLSELAARPGTTDAVPDAPERIATIARRLVDGVSDIVWAINPARDHAVNLAQRMRFFATGLLRARGIEFAFTAPSEDEDHALDGEQRRELLLAFQEIVNNAARHSGCSRLNARLAIEGRDLVLDVADDGCGFDPAVAEGSGGTGLSSLRQRVERLGGTLSVGSAPGRGARVAIRVPLRRRRSLPVRGGRPPADPR